MQLKAHGTQKPELQAIHKAIHENFKHLVTQ